MLVTKGGRQLRFRLAEVRFARLLVIATAGVAALVVAPATASASTPDHGTFVSHEFVVDSEVCAPEGFSVDVVEDEVGAFRVFFDRSGAVAFVAVHVDYRTVISVNGHTIVERDKWKDTFYPDGMARTVGDTVHIQGAGPGLVQHDAGQLVSTRTNPSARSTVPTRSSRARRSASHCCHSRQVRHSGRNDAVLHTSVTRTPACAL
jgi:hypothetical protein